MQVCKIEGLGYFFVKDLHDRAGDISFDWGAPAGKIRTDLGKNLAFTEGDSGTWYWCSSSDDVERLLSRIKPLAGHDELTLEVVQQWAKDNGYTLKKKGPVVQTWKYHQHDLNTNPEALLEAKVGDICKLQTYYFKVESTSNGQIYLTMIDLHGRSIKPKEIGKTQGSYEYVHVRDYNGYMGTALFSRSELIRMIKEEDYKIN